MMLNRFAPVAPAPATEIARLRTERDAAEERLDDAAAALKEGRKGPLVIVLREEVASAINAYKRACDALRLAESGFSEVFPHPAAFGSY